jgi:hypothetical protein
VPVQCQPAGLVVLAQLPEQRLVLEKPGHPVVQMGELLADEPKA